jgi:hypothetical protein
MAVDCLKGIGVGNGDMIGSDSDDIAVLSMDFVDVLAALARSSPVTEPGVAELGKPRARYVAKVVWV